MTRFVRFCAFLSVLFFASNVFAAGYTCSSTKTYTSCNVGYCLSNDACTTVSGYTCPGGAGGCSACYKSCSSYQSGGYTYTPNATKIYYPNSCSYDSECTTPCNEVENNISTTSCTTETSITNGKRIGSGTKDCEGNYTNTACYSASGVSVCSGCDSYSTTCDVTSYSCSCNSGYSVSGSGSSCSCACTTPCNEVENDISTTSCTTETSIANGKRIGSGVATCDGYYTNTACYTAGGSCSGCDSYGSCDVKTYYCSCNSGYHAEGSGLTCTCEPDCGTETCPYGYRNGPDTYDSCIYDAGDVCYQNCTKTCSGNDTSSCPSNATCTYDTSYSTSGKYYYGKSCNASSSKCPVKSYTCNSGYYDNGSGCSSCTNSGTCPSGWRDGGTYYNSCIYDAGDVCYKSCTAYTSGGYTYTPTSSKAYYSDSCSYSSACTTACNEVENDISTISCTPSNSVPNAYSTTCPTGTKPCTGNYTNTACYSAGASCSGCSQYGSCSTSCYAKSCKSGYYLDSGSCHRCDPTYPYSSAGTTGDSGFCYRYCTTSDVPNSSEVSGIAYSDGIGDSCKATSCEPDYYLSNGSCKECEPGCTCAGGTAQPVCCSTSKSCSSDFSGYSGTYNECTQNQSSKCYKSCTKTCSGNDTSSCPDNATCTYDTSYPYTGTQYYGGSCSATAGKCPIISFTCDPGYYKNSAGTACVKCESGYYCTGDNTRKACTSWRANTNTDGLTGSTGTSACVCAAGYSLSGSSCTACSCGYYKGSAGNTSCTKTTAGYYATGTGNTSQTKADAGSYATAGACSQTACGGGKYSAAGASSCTNISAGCYGTSASSACPASCAKGTYSLAGASACTNVSAGCYADTTGSKTACPKSCPAGTYGSTTGLTSSACSGSCTANYYCPAGSTSNKQKPCPSGYPYSAAGAGAITSCYSGTKPRAWSGSQTPCSKPTNCATVTCEACSKGACNYVAYANSAGTGDGTIKSGCSSNSDACQQTVKSVTANANHYVDGKTCPACGSSYPYSDGGNISSSYCYATKTNTGSQIPCSQPLNSASYTCGTCTTFSTCNWRDYNGATDTTCTPDDCAQPVSSVTCNTGYYKDGVTCPECTNKPANSSYTGTATSNSCPWSCNDGYNQTADNQCGQFCGAGITHLHLGNGVSIPLYSSALTSPAINVKWNDTVCYGSLEIGNASGLNVKVGSITYHAVN